MESKTSGKLRAPAAGDWGSSGCKGCVLAGLWSSGKKRKRNPFVLHARCLVPDCCRSAGHRGCCRASSVPCSLPHLRVLKPNSTPVKEQGSVTPGLCLGADVSSLTMLASTLMSRLGFLRGSARPASFCASLPSPFPFSSSASKPQPKRERNEPPWALLVQVLVCESLCPACATKCCL